MKKYFLCLVAFLSFGLLVNAELVPTRTYPVENASNIPTTSVLVLLFSEPITLGTGECTLNGVPVAPRLLGKNMMFSPAMSYFTSYTLEVPEGIAINAAGEKSDPVTLHFTTAPAPLPYGCDARVSTDGSGYASLQEAVDAAPSNSDKRHVIYVFPGTYEGTTVIPAEKKNLTIWGVRMEDVILKQAKPETPTLNVEAEGCYLYNLTVKNESGEADATALAVKGDKTMARYCDFWGTSSVVETACSRSYFYQCYLQGTSRLIAGNGTGYFDYCTLKMSDYGPAVSAATTDSQPYGYVLANSRLIGTTSGLLLGEANSASAAIAYVQCELPSFVSTQGWDKGAYQNARFHEYMNYGAGARTVEGIRYISEEETGNYTDLQVLKQSCAETPVKDFWNPFNVLASTGKNAITWIEGDGYGANRGGNGGKEVTVSTASELAKYISLTDRYIIKVKGTIDITGNALTVGANTTLMGMDEASTIVGNLRINEGTRNVIIKYLNITHPGELKANDGISMEGNHVALIHHVSFYDCSDGCCDMRNSTDSVTLSWVKYYYVNQTDGHRFTTITDGVILRDASGNTIGFGEPLHVTYHHAWWSTLCHERMPSSTNAVAHLFNNYWSCEGNFYCSLARDNSDFYSESNYYNKVKNPLYKGNYSSRIFASNNVYNQCSGSIWRGKDDLQAPTYKYVLGQATDLPEAVSARAGNVWIDVNYQPTSVPTIASQQPLVKVVETGFLIQLPEPAASAKVEVYSLQGHSLFKQTYANQQLLELNGLTEKGAYLLKWTIDGKEKAKVMVRP